MERWRKPLSFRWSVVLGAGLLALSLNLASYRIRAVEPEKPRPAAPKEKEAPKKPAAAKLKREALRYGGKNFDQWRVELETELKPEIRADGLAALAAFGANGYGPEATRAIVDLMKGYDLHTLVKKDREVVEAAFAAIAKIDEPAVPVLWESLRSDNRRVRRFAIDCLRQSRNDFRESVPLLLKAARDEDKYVREMALIVLQTVKEKPKGCVPVLLDCLKDKEPTSRRQAMWNLKMMKPQATEVMPALRAAIKDSDSNVRDAAIGMAGSYGAEAKPVVPALLELLDKPNLGDYFLEIMDAFAAIGPEAKEALPRLRKLREEPIADTSYSAPGRSGNYGQVIAQTIKKIEGK